MDGVFRLILRFLLVPTGVLVALVAQVLIILFGQWQLGSVVAGVINPEQAVDVMAALMSAMWLTSLFLGLAWLVAAIGILFSEAFAIRSWIFHLANVTLCTGLATRLFPLVTGEAAPMEDLLYILAAGFAGGLAYWIIAGWSAGFYRPVFATRA